METHMDLTLQGIKHVDEWKKAGVSLPVYDVEAVREKTRKNPRWAHFGIGNIFRVFLGGIADSLLSQGELDRGITCIETFDYELVDKIYAPFDNLALTVILKGDGTRDIRVLASLAESLKTDFGLADSYSRLAEIFRCKDLQFVSFTITEKGYALRNTDGKYSSLALSDIDNGPTRARGAMAIVTAMLLERYKCGAVPIALVSMDNCSHNGDVLRSSILEITAKWMEKGYVDYSFVQYVNDSSRVSFPWTMIDKITPRPSLEITSDLEKLGIKNMQPVITSKKTYIAPFINAEGPQYLVVEDNFPNGRPNLEKAGVYMTDRETVDKAERMKVTVCLNPIHTALGPYGVVLGYDLFADELADSDMLNLAKKVGYGEGMDVVPDPGILSPKDFIDECMYERFPNRYLGDTCVRLCTDASQGLGVRFGVTIKSYVAKYGDASKLVGIPLAIAGWLRYLLGVDDQGNRYELAPDPMAEPVVERLSSIIVGQPSTLTNQLKWILSNEHLFFIDLYEAGIGELIEQIFREEIAGTGAVRATVNKYLS